MVTDNAALAREIANECLKQFKEINDRDPNFVLRLNFKPTRIMEIGQRSRLSMALVIVIIDRLNMLGIEATQDPTTKSIKAIIDPKKIVVNWKDQILD